MKKILIISYMMKSGGVEVSLLNFIKKLKEDKNIYVKLLLFKKDGTYLENFKESVDIDEIEFTDSVYNLAIPYKEEKNVIKKIKKIFLKAFNKYNFKNINKYLIKHTNRYDEFWDMAIDFHGYGYLGTTFLALKVNAKTKVSFIHDEKIEWMKKNEFILDKIDYYFAVSESCSKEVEKKYPFISKKMKVFHNILDEEKIKILSNEKIDDSFDGNFKLLTIGRLEKQKGYDILLSTAMKLKMNNINYKWYIIGTGTLKKNIEHKILKNKLQNDVILLGMKKNPYPYIKQCDMYIQPSKHEGYGIAIAEARILNKLIIASNLPCISEQIKNEKNGILSNVNSDDFYNKIIYLNNNEQLKKTILNNLKKEKNVDNMDLIYELLN